MSPSARSPRESETAGLGTPYSTVGLQITFTGNFYSLTDLLYRLNSLVSVRDGELDASGRLFSVTTIGLSPIGNGNGLKATVDVTAFVYGEPPGSQPAPAVTPSTTDTTGSTGSTTTPAPSSDVAPQP